MKTFRILILTAIILFIIAIAGCVDNAKSADRTYNNGWTYVTPLPSEIGLSKIDVGNNETCYYAKDGFSVNTGSLSCVKEK